MVLRDSFGRPLLNLRLAITSRCDLRCQFCHMEGEANPHRDSLREMTVHEIGRIVKIGTSLGITRVKLTGGEPLVRKDILEIVKAISSTGNLSDLSMTTNGALLAPQAQELFARGLKRVNISLPTLDAEVYNKLTGGRIEDALKGVEAAVDAGFYPVKINMVILKCVNDHDFLTMLRFAAQTGAILQLIELEPVNIDSGYYSANHKAPDEYESMLRQKAVHMETRRFMQNRRIYHLPDVDVEVVHPIENTEFCSSCTRLRVTSDGKFKPCLMKNDNLVDFLTPMRNGAGDAEIERLFMLANLRRQPYVYAEQRAQGPGMPAYCSTGA
jgi:cyclic pyranopterin phosphate synthase